MLPAAACGATRPAARAPSARAKPKYSRLTAPTPHPCAVPQQWMRCLTMDWMCRCDWKRWRMRSRTSGCGRRSRCACRRAVYACTAACVPSRLPLTAAPCRPCGPCPADPGRRGPARPGGASGGCAVWAPRPRLRPQPARLAAAQRRAGRVAAAGGEPGAGGQRRCAHSRWAAVGGCGCLPAAELPVQGRAGPDGKGTPSSGLYCSQLTLPHPPCLRQGRLVLVKPPRWLK